MKSYLILIIAILLASCSSSNDESSFYKTNTEILEQEYNLKREAFIKKVNPLGHYSYVDSIEKIIIAIKSVNSNDARLKFINDIEMLVKESHVNIAPSIFSELKNCSFNNSEKSDYYTALLKLSFINAEIQDDLLARFSFDAAVAEYKVISVGDSLQISAYMSGINIFNPNYVVVGKDTFSDYGGCTNSISKLCFKYKNIPHDSVLENAKFYYYSAYDGKYVSTELYNENR